LRLGEGRFIEWAPQYRLLPFVNVAGRDDLPELPDDCRLVIGGHGQIGMLPVAEDAEPLELFPLDLDELVGVFPAALPDLDLAHSLLLRSELLEDLMLDRKAVTVPSRNIGGGTAAHRFRFNDEVF